MSNSNFDAIATTTLRNYRKKLADNVSTKILLFHELRDKKALQPEDGGRTIVEPLLYGLGSLQSFDGFDVLDADPVEGITAAEYERKFAAAPIVVSDTDLTKNMSKHQIISLLETKIQQAEITMREGINEMWWSDGLGNGGKDMNGLQNLIEVDTTNATTTTPTLVGSGTVGGITRSSTNDYWQVYNNKGTKTTSAGDNLIECMRLMQLYLDKRGGVDIQVTTKDVLSLYMSLLEDNMRHTDNRLGDAGFMNVAYMGVPIAYDDDCPSGYMYYLNFTYMKLRINTRWNFITTPFEKPAKQFARFAYIVVGGNLTISNGHAFGLTHSIT